jgi:hypothetical protein
MGQGHVDRIQAGSLSLAIPFGVRHFNIFGFGFSVLLMTRSGDLGIETPEVVKPKSILGKGHGHIWWSCGGEDSRLVHFLCRWIFREGPVDLIRGVPVRARKN